MRAATAAGAAAGAVKQKAGKMMHDRRLKDEGKAERAEGRVRTAVGHAKDAVRELAGKK